MLIKFTRGGRGSGRQVADYLTAPDRADREHAPPEVVRGDMDRTRDLIDSISRVWSYTHGVLSFALEDAPDADQQEAAMDAFERLAFAGLDAEQYDITWVRHQHTEGGRVELHFVTPRMELVTGKALNIAPPGWERSYAPLRDVLNWTHGWARPDDPERALELHRAPERALEGYRLREGRDGLHDYLTALVAAQTVTDRASMVVALEEAGLQVPRQGKDYLTVLDPESGERFRMKGRIYEKEWTYDRELDRQVAKEAVHADGRDRGVDQERADAACREFEAAVHRRAEHHAERYPTHRIHYGPGVEDRDVDRALDVDRPDRDLAADHGLLDLALDASEARDRDVPDLHGGRADVPDPARRDRSDDLPTHQHQRAGAVRDLAERELDDDGADSLRARLARTVRDLGEGVRDFARRLEFHLDAVAGFLYGHRAAFEGDRRQAARDREHERQAALSLERAERAYRELGDASEQAAERTLTLVQERKAHARELERAKRRERSWGDDYGL